MSSRRIIWGAALLGTLALAFGALGIAGAAKQTKTKTFSSGSLSLPILDDDVAATDVNVPKKGKLKDLNVSLRLEHTDLGDILIYVVSPKGRRALIWGHHDQDFQGNDFENDEDLGSGSNSCLGSKTTFDDEASADIDELQEDTDGHVGTFQPPGSSLSSFDGVKIRGTWSVVVRDDTGGDEGELGCADLRIKYKKKKN